VPDQNRRHILKILAKFLLFSQKYVNFAFGYGLSPEAFPLAASRGRSETVVNDGCPRAGLMPRHRDIDRKGMAD
jgi:hypothetical protein